MSKKNNYFKWFLSPNQTAVVFACGFIILSSSSYIGKNVIAESISYDEKKKAYEDLTDINSVVFKEAYQDYERYISLIANEIKKSDMNNSAIEAFIAYNTLEHNGLISLGDKFTYENSFFEPIGNMGISVVLGEGVCRNEAYNLYHVFKSLDYECGIVSGELYTNRPTGNDNHVVVWVKDGDTSYLFDPTNQTLFLRNFLGQYVSIDDKENKFYPSIYSDNLYNNLTDNLSFYSYSKDDYSSRITYNTKRDRAQEKVLEKIDYYKEYEEKYLIDYELEIKKLLEEYKEKYEELSEEKDISRLELK